MVLAQSRLHDVVRERRPDLWETMGRPSMTADITSWAAYRRSREAGWRVDRLIFSRAATIGDPLITRRVWHARIALLYCAAIVGAAILFTLEPGLLA